MPTADDLLQQVQSAVRQDDSGRVQSLLASHPEVRARINDPVAAFDSPIILGVRSRKMLDVLLEAGADINARSRWWAGGFGLLDGASPELAAYALQRGAVLDINAAARLDLGDKVQAFLSSDPALVHARGGDGQTPLHVASSVEVAKILLDHGADINARDVDHESTPAQYMVRDRQEVARYLVERGCATDLLMTAALGDYERSRKHLDADPACIRMRASDEYFPKKNPHSGGTIYQWTLGWYATPHEVASRSGHEAVVQLLMERSPADVKLLALCSVGDEEAVKTLVRQFPQLVTTLETAFHRHVADAARNNNSGAVRLMLGAGLPVDARGQHGGTPLHWAAFHGNAEMTRAILSHQPALELVDRDFNATPVGWAIHGSEHGWYCQTGDYATTLTLLLDAGAQPPKKPGGSPKVREVLQARGITVVS